MKIDEDEKDKVKKRKQFGLSKNSPKKKIKQ